MQMHIVTTIAITAGLLLSGTPVLADAPSKTLSPYFLVESGDESPELFPLKRTTVEAVINGVIADVKVTQDYTNMGGRPINARYVFPASTRAAVHGMRMTIGEDVVVAQIKERQTAKQTFQTAKAAGKSASLLEQQRPNVFTMDVANIMPGKNVTIELHYSELLIPETGQYRFVYPTVAGPRYSTVSEAVADDRDQWIENPYLTADQKPASQLHLAITLASGLPLQRVACATHATDVRWESEAQAHITLADSELHGGNRDFILKYRLSGDQIHSGLMLHKGESENFFMLMVQPPERISQDAIPPREYIFIVDVSGSMHGFALDTAKTLIKELIGGLRPIDNFNVILFAGAAKVLAPACLPADPAHIAAALQHIDGAQGGGGTELHRAIKKGLALPRTSDRSRTMVVVTDGYIASEKEVFALVADNLNHSNLFAFGIGSSVNRYLIEGLANAGMGEPFVVTDPRSAGRAAKRFQDYIKAPLLTSINIDFGQFDAYDIEPQIVGDLFARRPLVICGKWRGAPQGTVAMTGYTGRGEYEQQYMVSPHAVSPGSSRALPYLWARTRLSRLADFASRDQDETTRAAVTRLGLNYNLLTEYTSFVAVHERVCNTTAPAKDMDQPLPMPHGVSNLAVAGRNVPEPELGAMLVLLSLAGLLWMRLRRRQFP
jgi:Ca-activated chloride channel family protein